MFYHFFKYIEETYNISGAGLFQFITFRAAMAIILSLLITMVFGKSIINKLSKLQIEESVRDLGLTGQKEKEGTPTMGGLIILFAIVFPVLLFAKLDNIYIVLLLVSTVWLGVIGFIDDYIKVFKKDKAGLRGWFKILAQVGLGILVGVTLYFHQDVKVRDYDTLYSYIVEDGVVTDNIADVQPANGIVIEGNGKFIDGNFVSHDVRNLETNIPFFKSNKLDYNNLFGFLGHKWAWLAYVMVMIFIITAVSNAANLTDGIDGLATGISAIIMVTLGLFAYVSGNIQIADYLNVLYIPNTGELMIFAAAFAGACIGFLWYNSYPAQIFMGDTGSLALGGIIATMAIVVRKELLIPILCGVFFIENLSVMIQVGYFKYSRKKHGEGRRVFKMAPLHHHYQKLEFHESKIVVRFWIIQILLSVFAVLTLKLR